MIRVCSLVCLGLHQHVLQEITPRARDSLVSFGERLSTRLLAGYLRRLEVPATQFDAWRLGIMTSDEFTDAQVRCLQRICVSSVCLVA